MLLLTLICVLISALIFAIAALWLRLAPRRPELAHEKALYAGFVADVERRLARGDIDADAAHEEQVEAARALLKASEAHDGQSVPLKPVYGLATIVLVAGLTFGVYLYLGHPSLGDQPYKQRLAAWTHIAKTEPDSLPPQAMAAVLRQGVAQNGKDPAYWLFLGRIDMIAGNAYDGAKDYEAARNLSPQTFRAWSELGEALTFVSKGAGGKDAEQAFEKALELDPKDARAHFYLGNMAVAQGQYDAGKAHFQAALDTMTADDASRPQVEQALKAAGAAQTADATTKGRIRGMVAALDAQLKASPDNPEGWARLLRSYDVLGDAAAKDAALKAMQAHYHDRPEIVADIVTKSQSTVGAEDTGGQ